MTFGILFSGVLLHAQEAQKTDDKTPDDQVVKLSPFEVQSTATAGYGAQYSSSSSRLNIRYVDVPQSVSVVTSEFLSDAHLFDSHDFAKFVNSVYPRTNTHSSEVFYIRGLQVGHSYVDGFLTPLAINRDSALYDRIEYVKGPASAAMGRGEAGGLVNFVSKRPVGRNFDTLTTTVGTDSFYRVELDHNQQLGTDGTKGYRVPVYFEDADGTRTGEIMHSRKYGFGPSFRWDISSDTQLAVNTNYIHYEGPGNVGETYWSGSDVYDYMVQLKQIDPNNNWNPRIDPLIPDDQLFGWAGKGRVDDVVELSAILNHQFTDELSYRQGVYYGTFDEEYRRFHMASGAPPDPNKPGNFLMGLTYTHYYNENDALRIQGDLLWDKKIGNTSHQFLVGYDYTDNSSYTRNGARGGLTQSMYSPDYNLPAGFDPDTYITNYTTDRNADGSGFGFYGQYSGSFFNDKINVMAGWRKDSTKSTTHNNRDGSETKADADTDVPRYSVTYKPFRDISIYYLHSEQADPSVTQNRWGNWSASAGATLPDPSDPRYDELISSQVTAALDEVGVKASLLNDKVTVSFAAYEINRTGFLQHTFAAEPGANGIGTVNVNRFYILSGESVRGFEVELFGQPTRRLSLSTGFSAPQGEKPDSSGMATPIEALIPSAYFNGKYDFRNVNQNGFQVTFGAKYWFRGWVMTAGSIIPYKEDQYSIDAGASYSWAGGRYPADLRCNNILNDLIYMTQNSQWALRRVYLSFKLAF
jgi:outer membrane receptor protein involved in Fe transport